MKHLKLWMVTCLTCLNKGTNLRKNSLRDVFWFVHTATVLVSSYLIVLVAVILNNRAPSFSLLLRVLFLAGSAILTFLITFLFVAAECSFCAATGLPFSSLLLLLRRNRFRLESTSFRAGLTLSLWTTSSSSLCMCWSIRFFFLEGTGIVLHFFLLKPTCVLRASEPSVVVVVVSFIIFNTLCYCDVYC